MTKKFLIFFGSPRAGGYTAQMLERLLSQLPGKKKVINSYQQKHITPCIDCRLCWKEKNCALKDDMQQIYHLVDECDCLIFASPVYFHSLPAPLKQIVDRFQVYWAGQIRGDFPKMPTKIGAVLLTGGAPAFPDQFTCAEKICTTVFNDIGARSVGSVTLSNSDHSGLIDQSEIMESIDSLAEAIIKNIL